MKNFSLTMPTYIHFGKGSLKKMLKHISKYSKILLVTGGESIRKNGIYDEIINILKGANIKIFEVSGVKPNPGVDKVYEGIEICKKNKIEFIIAAGGGSVIDTAKAIAAGVKYDGDVWELFHDESKVKDAIKIGAIITLAATGSETNGNSVITKEETNEKLAIHNDVLKPVFAIMDPTYTFSVNKYQTAAGTADILAHVFEQYFSPTKDTYVIDRISESIMKTVIKFGPIAYKNPENYEARAQLMYSSSLALIGILSSGKIADWATHAMEHEISAYHDLTHGVGLAILFPNWLKYCFSEETAWKYREFAINVWNLDPSLDDKTLANKAIEKTQEFFKSLNLPLTLKEVNIDDTNLEKWVSNIVKRRKSIGAFKVLFEDDIRNIYKMSL